MNRQTTCETPDYHTEEGDSFGDLQGIGQPTTPCELSFSLWLDEQLWDLEQRWSHFCTDRSIATLIDR
ncbi:MAG: hypothetical protein IID44_26810 [Planctomycetes bacterium]|nr:hypothetical protein [Planctomycetota bacterium]